ncbi:Unknown protein, partial [Striga hermonthica]
SIFGQQRLVSAAQGPGRAHRRLVSAARELGSVCRYRKLEFLNCRSSSQPLGMDTSGQGCCLVGKCLLSVTLLCCCRGLHSNCRKTGASLVAGGTRFAGYLVVGRVCCS